MVVMVLDKRGSAGTGEQERVLHAKPPLLLPKHASHTARVHALQVDYSRMETDLLARKEAQVRAATATLKPKETPVSGKGAEFHAALSRFTGVDETKLLAPAEVRSLTQGERVKRLASQLHALFNQYDNGESNMWTQHCTQLAAVQHFTAHATTPPNSRFVLALPCLFGQATFLLMCLARSCVHTAWM